MEATEAGNVLSRLVAAWPRMEWTDDTVELWLQALEEIGYEEGCTAAATAVKTLEWPPSIAWFRGTARAERDRRSYHALPAAAPVDDDLDVPALIAQARAALRGQPAS